ncbi:MAG: protein kinase [Planctomycetota bacterium]|jgi:serine/threonine-protein kinase|nr:protein kinase [Planctomycetota bacterium]MDP6762544.1 protein kinase [Planctomycetota bacterium]MDP6990983.1 protein kinase [Planctomycetota bacterium]
MDWETFFNSFREPDFIAGYEIQNRLGGGAFGEVYKARKHSIGKSYAIKFLKIDDEGQREAIERELEQVRHFAVIDHPNLVTIEDLGTVMGVPYLVMGYAGEETLARRLKRGDLPAEEATTYFVQACRGVLALHDRRLVHFDLKPGNIFLKGDVARVGDYGLSKLMSEGRQTLSFGRGTPHYMAPEILKSRADHRADLYSLGVILYESLAGSVPYEPATPGGLILRQEDVPPVFPEEFPAKLRVVVERCLRVDPDDRYDGVQALLEALGQTARPGDSITFGPSQGFPAPPAPLAGEPATPTGSVAASQAGELRGAAAELTRGAVEVARGMWDGLKTAGSPRPEGTTAVADGEPTPLPPPSTPLGAPEPSPADAVAVTPASAGPAPGAGAASRGTVPVPPPASGGPLGAVLATVGLAFEVLGALLGGLVGFARRLWAGGGLGSLVRLAVFLLLFATVGGLLAGALLTALMMGSVW